MAEEKKYICVSTNGFALSVRGQTRYGVVMTKEEMLDRHSGKYGSVGEDYTIYEVIPRKIETVTIQDIV